MTKTLVLEIAKYTNLRDREYRVGLLKLLFAIEATAVCFFILVQFAGVVSGFAHPVQLGLAVVIVALYPYKFLLQLRLLNDDQIDCWNGCSWTSQIGARRPQGGRAGSSR